MPIKKSVIINVPFEGDGSSTVMSVDLEREPYFVASSLSGITSAEALANWLTDGRAAKPTGASNGTTRFGTAFTSVLVYPILTLTFASAVPSFDVASVELLF